MILYVDGRTQGYTQTYIDDPERPQPGVIGDYFSAISQVEDQLEKNRAARELQEKKDNYLRSVDVLNRLREFKAEIEQSRDAKGSAKRKQAKPEEVDKLVPIMVELYKLGKSVRYIAAELGIHHTTVHKRLKAKGVA